MMYSAQITVQQHPLAPTMSCGIARPQLLLGQTAYPCNTVAQQVSCC